MTRGQSRKRGQHEKEMGGIPRLILTATKAALLSLFFSFLLAALVSAILINLNDPISAIVPSSLAVLYVSSFLSGFLCCKKLRERVLVSGALSGGVLMLLCIFVSLFLYDDFSAARPFPVSLLLHLLIIVSSVLGAYTAKSALAKKRKRKR